MASGQRKPKAQVWIFRWQNKATHELQILLLKTIPLRGAHWQPVTGSVEEGESFEAGALREAREESGYAFSDPAKLIDLNYDFEFHGRQGHVHEKCFALECTGDPKAVRIDPKEHQEYEWVSVDEARKRVTFHSNREALEKLLGFLGLFAPKVSRY